jgi:hypothetical protein
VWRFKVLEILVLIGGLCCVGFINTIGVVVLRVVRGDKKRTQCPGVQLCHPVPGGYKYRDLALQVESLK